MNRCASFLPKFKSAAYQGVDTLKSKASALRESQSSYLLSLLFKLRER